MKKLISKRTASSGFTLIELLVVIAIIAILAAILFPVFAQAKTAAKKTVAISNMKQTGIAVAMYGSDYDDGEPLSNSGCLTSDPTCYGWGFGPPDVVPFEAMYPYTKNFDITIDPMSDLQGVANREQAQFTYMQGFGNLYPPNIAQGTPAELEYAAGVRSNIGYNFAFFSPWILQQQGSVYYVGSYSTNASQITQPAHTLMWGDASIWNEVGGSPTGGGNWVIQTPCWLDANGNYLQPFAQLEASGELASYGSGWSLTDGWLIYGGLWPFYNVTQTNAATGAQIGQVIIGFADSHAKAMSISAVADGCSAYGTGAYKGTVTDPTKFIWAVNQ